MILTRNFYLLFTIMVLGISLSACDNANNANPESENTINETVLEEATEEATEEVTEEVTEEATEEVTEEATEDTPTE